jgi:hypothetical protein
MRAALAVIGVIIILVLFGTMMAGIQTAQTDERTDTFLAVTTGGGITTAPVVLVTDIYDNNILNVTSITSDNVLDAPLADSYNSANNTLTVRGLNASDTRGLTVIYEYSALTGSAESAGTFLNLIPILVGVACLVILVGAGIFVFAHKGGG